MIFDIHISEKRWIYLFSIFAGLIFAFSLRYADIEVSILATLYAYIAYITHYFLRYTYRFSFPTGAHVILLSQHNAPNFPHVFAEMRFHHFFVSSGHIRLPLAYKLFLAIQGSHNCTVLILQVMPENITRKLIVELYTDISLCTPHTTPHKNARNQKLIYFY